MSLRTREDAELQPKRPRKSGCHHEGQGQKADAVEPRAHPVQPGSIPAWPKPLTCRGQLRRGQVFFPISRGIQGKQEASGNKGVEGKSSQSALSALSFRLPGIHPSRLRPGTLPELQKMQSPGFHSRPIGSSILSDSTREPGF